MKQIPLREVRTARLLLRAPVAEDLNAAIAIHSDPQTNRFNRSPFPPERVRELLNNWLADWHGTGIGYWAVCTHADEHAVIGFGGIRHKQMDDVASLNLYFRFAPAAWSQGFASETARAALAAAFNTLRAPHVRAMVRPANTPSIKTLERVGLRMLRKLNHHEDGEHLLYEITAEMFSLSKA
jgi:[ribosomal protein S5]-alanine N-acetyltransferase